MRWLLLCLVVACGTAAEPIAEEDVKEKAHAEQRDAEQAARVLAAKLQASLDDLEKKIVGAIDVVLVAQTENDRAFAKNKLEHLRREKADLEARLAAANRTVDRRPPDPPPVELEKLARELATLDKHIADAIDTVVTSQDDLDRGLATHRLARLRREKADLEKRIDELKEAKLRQDIAALDKKIAAAAAAVMTAQDHITLVRASRELARLRAERAELEARLAKPNRIAGHVQHTEVEKVQQDIAALDKKIAAALDAVATAQNEQDREAAKLEQLKLAKERNKLLERLNVLQRSERIRKRASQLSGQCRENPLANGCF